MNNVQLTAGTKVTINGADYILKGSVIAEKVPTAEAPLTLEQRALKAIEALTNARQSVFLNENIVQDASELEGRVKDQMEAGVVSEDDVIALEDEASKAI